MTGKSPLIEPIEGYTVAVFKSVESGEPTNLVSELDLKLTKVGGAHIVNPDSLIMMIEDAVFKEEENGKANG